MIRYITRHIVRAPAKSLLGMAVALFFILAMGILQNTIASIEAEIDRIYTQTTVNAEIRLSEDFSGTRRITGDFVPMPLIQDIVALGIVHDMYLEASGLGFIVGPSSSPYTILDEVEIVPPTGGIASAPGSDIFVGVNDLRHLTAEPDGFVGRDPSFNMQIQFAPELTEDSFVYTDDAPIPIILSQALAQEHGLAPGDSAYIVYYQPILFRQGDWHYSSVMILGIHDGQALQNIVQEGAVIPLPALETMFGDLTGFNTVKFTIDPSFNRELATVSQEINNTMRLNRYPWREAVRADIWDQELRFGVASLAQHVVLLRLLFPIAMVISAIIGASLAMLLVLQNAKNAAIMRILGTPKPKAFFTLWLWQITICVAGGLTGLLLTIVIGLRTDLIIVTVPYLTGAIIGAATGALLVTGRAPLDMLQVKE
ncbi:MAG: hypothetical protein FWD03_09135 [Defluviitaleaceae bacterium]|nr:hypothetical protein [Defluviitaleaceae bacterium]